MTQTKKIALFINSQLVQPALVKLINENRLGSVVLDKDMVGMHYFAEFAASKNIPVFFSEKNKQNLLCEHLANNNITCGMIFGYPYPFKQAVIDQLSDCFLNFHFALLPEHRGPDPIFWQIRNRKSMGGLCVHKVLSKLDSGDIVYRHAIPLQHGETYGSHVVRLFSVSERGINECMKLLDENQLDQVASPQTESQAHYQRKPEEADFYINWRHPALEIEALIRACNPFYLGAIARHNMLLIKVLEAELSTHSIADASPGTLLEHPTDLLVACGDQKALKLNLIQTDAGLYTGERFRKVGICPPIGSRFSI